MQWSVRDWWTGHCRSHFLPDGLTKPWQVHLGWQPCCGNDVSWCSSGIRQTMIIKFQEGLSVDGDSECCDMSNMVRSISDSIRILVLDRLVSDKCECVHYDRALLFTGWHSVIYSITGIKYYTHLMSRGVDKFLPIRLHPLTSSRDSQIWKYFHAHDSVDPISILATPSFVASRSVKSISVAKHECDLLCQREPWLVCYLCITITRPCIVTQCCRAICIGPKVLTILSRVLLTWPSSSGNQVQAFNFLTFLATFSAFSTALLLGFCFTVEISTPDFGSGSSAALILGAFKPMYSYAIPCFSINCFLFWSRLTARFIRCSCK